MRRTKPEKRIVEPDVRFNNLNIQVLIHHVLKKGKKSTATRIVYDAMDIIEDKLKKSPIEVMELGIEKCWPSDGSPPAQSRWCHVSGTDGSRSAAQINSGYSLVNVRNAQPHW